MIQGTHRIHLRKEAFKFASGHMTVFPGEVNHASPQEVAPQRTKAWKETLHGHNYTVDVTLDLESISLDKFIPFTVIKTAIVEICDHWDEKVLLPRICPFLEIKSETVDEIEFLLCEKRYILPRDEVLFLDLDNITVETLAKEFCQQFLQRINLHKNSSGILGVQLRIDETPGQGASFYWRKSNSIQN